ncbi:MAG TPA: hypothetical protein DCP68_05185 [Ruminococcus sp.]|nr:hypothetical protein [Ruminococcus sp.]
MTYTLINGDFSILKTVLTNSGYFTSVEDGSFEAGVDPNRWTYNNALICTADGVAGFFKYGWMRHNGYNVNIYGLAVNQGRTPSFELTAGWSGDMDDDYFPVATYQTSNGLSIICRRARILITRNQKGKTVVVTGSNQPISSGSSTDYIMGAISAIATTDDTELAAFPMQTAIEWQTLLVPICTQSSTVSYTDKAALLAHKQYAVIGDILYGGKRYFSDGYFAIEDGEV